LLIISAFILSLLIIVLAICFSQKQIKDIEKLSSFECGFIPQSEHRIPFSLHFFLVGILFLIFDIELVILFPYFLIGINRQFFNIVLCLALIILAVGLLIEWSQKILE